MKTLRVIERLGLREGVELLLGAAALVVSAISLWVAVGTEQANRQMVAAASWPLLQADTADIPEGGRPVIAFLLVNGAWDRQSSRAWKSRGEGEPSPDRFRCWKLAAATNRPRGRRICALPDGLRLRRAASKTR